MLWLWEVFVEFAAAVERGDKSWWPFILSVVALTTIAVGFAVWLAWPTSGYRHLFFKNFSKIL